MHGVEGVFHVVDSDPLGDELLQRQPALLIEVDQRGKVRSGRQSPYHEDFNDPPREKMSIKGISTVMSGVGTPTSTTMPARSRTKKPPAMLGAPDGINDNVGAEAAGQLAHRRHGVFLDRVDRMRRAEVFGPLQFLVVAVDRDDHCSPGHAGTRDGRVADTTAADDRDGVTPTDISGVHRGSQTCHDATAQQTHHRGIGGRVDLVHCPACTKVLSANAPMPSAA